jgi:hypothetical protein
MQKSYLFPVQIGFSLANASYIYIGYIETVLFLIIGNAVKVMLLDIGKLDIYCRKD